MTTVIAQATYQTIEFGIFKRDTCLETVVIPKQYASKQLIGDLLATLDKHHIALSSLTFIGANLGPAPFTTLRVLIATLNGIGFATHIPLIGVDGLHAFAHEVQSPDWPHTVIMLDAYQHDVYYAYHDKTGFCSIHTLLETLNTQLPTEPIRFIGNGTEKHYATIKQVFGERASIQHTPALVSLCAIAQQAFNTWDAQKTTTQLTPLYLKTSMPTG